LNLISIVYSTCGYIKTILLASRRFLKTDHDILAPVKQTKVKKMKTKINYTGEENAPNWTADPKGWDSWFLAFASKYKKESRNSFSIVYPEVIKLLQENFSNPSKRVKGIGRRVMIGLIKEKLPEINSGRISRAINKCLQMQVIELHHQTKTKKLIIKGQYWKTYVKEN